MVKKFFKNIKAKCKGFSLMELVVTIAIMAVLAAVLAPALIHYVEDSRAAKDDHAMSEVVNAVKVAIAYDDVYDELIDNITWKNSCYVDSDSPKNEHKELLFVDDNEELYQSYMYTDEERILDETPYKFHGRMYGATITFKPNNDHVIEIKDGVYSGEGTDCKISEMNEDNVLYTKIKQVIGNKIELTSATYKNSQYTIFICFGVEAEKSQGEYKVELSDEPMVIYGQWNGTNLLTIEMQDPSLDDTPDFNTSVQDGVIPEGGEYIDNSQLTSSRCPRCDYDFANPVCTWCYSQTLDENGYCSDCDQTFNPIYCYCSMFSSNDYKEALENNFEQAEITEFPTNPQYGDVYTYGDYVYVYGLCECCDFSPYYANAKTNASVYMCGGAQWYVIAQNDNGDTPGDFPYFDVRDHYEPWLTSIGGTTVNPYYLFWGVDTNSRIVEQIDIPNNAIINYVFRSYDWDYGMGTPLRVNEINYLGTKQEFANILASSYSSNWAYGLDTSYTNTIHCTDGNICVEHNNTIEGSEQLTSSVSGYTSTNYHYVKYKCNNCQLEYKQIASHTGGTATCQTKKVCTVCNQEYGSLAAHNYVADNTKPWQYSTTDKHARMGVCACGAEGKSTTTQNHTYVHTCQSSRCTGCGHTKSSMQSGAHTIVNGKCTLCGKTTNAVVIKADRNYVNYEAIGTWSFPDATSVNITVKVQMERDAYDWVNLVYGTSYVNGTTSAKCLTTSGSIGTYSLSSSSVKFASPSNNTSKTYTLTNIPMTSGTVVLRTDTSILYNGATITITPNYD